MTKNQWTCDECCDSKAIVFCFSCSPTAARLFCENCSITTHLSIPFGFEMHDIMAINSRRVQLALRRGETNTHFASTSLNVSEHNRKNILRSNQEERRRCEASQRLLMPTCKDLHRQVAQGLVDPAAIDIVPSSHIIVQRLRRNRKNKKALLVPEWCQSSAKPQQLKSSQQQKKNEQIQIAQKKLNDDVQREKTIERLLKPTKHLLYRCVASGLCSDIDTTPFGSQYKNEDQVKGSILYATSTRAKLRKKQAVQQEIVTKLLVEAQKETKNDMKVKKTRSENSHANATIPNEAATEMIVFPSVDEESSKQVIVTNETNNDIHSNDVNEDDENEDDDDDVDDELVQDLLNEAKHKQKGVGAQSQSKSIPSKGVHWQIGSEDDDNNSEDFANEKDADELLDFLDGEENETLINTYVVSTGDNDGTDTGVYQFTRAGNALPIQYDSNKEDHEPLNLNMMQSFVVIDGIYVPCQFEKTEKNKHLLKANYKYKQNAIKKCRWCRYNKIYGGNEENDINDVDKKDIWSYKGNERKSKQMMHCTCVMYQSLKIGSKSKPKKTKSTTELYRTGFENGRISATHSNYSLNESNRSSKPLPIIGDVSHLDEVNVQNINNEKRSSWIHSILQKSRS